MGFYDDIAEVLEDAGIPATETEFTINDDYMADWAVSKIKEAREERDRLVGVANEKIAALKEKIAALDDELERKTGFLTSELRKYAEKQHLSGTKTQRSYKLLSGDLVFKNAKTDIQHDDDALVEYLLESGYSDLVKIKKSPNWAEFKKLLQVQGDRVVNAETGELVEACTPVETPESFTVK